MKKILLIISMVLTSSYLLNAQDSITSYDSIQAIKIVPSLDTNQYKITYDKFGSKLYCKTDSLGNKLYCMIGIESYFDGEADSWRNFLVENLDINGLGKKLKSKDFIKNEFKQSAELEFTVCKDGSLCDFKVTNDVHPLVKEEALRVIKLSPNWKPGLINGDAVKSRKKQKITFLVTKD